MTWYGKYDEDDVPREKKEKKSNDDVRLTARYLNKGDDSDEELDIE